MRFRPGVDEASDMGLSWKGSGPNHSGHALQRYQVTLDAQSSKPVAGIPYRSLLP